MNLYPLLKSALFRLDPEQAHQLVHSLGRTAQSAGPALKLIQTLFQVESPVLTQSLCGITFVNPVGLAAGFDKNGEIVDFMAALGFGFVEVGSVTNQPSEGNAKPRLFRLPADHAVINRMGLNNRGPQALTATLAARSSRIPIGINIAKTNNAELQADQAAADMLQCYRAVWKAGDYTVFNLSCPNTKDGKTFEDPSVLRDLLRQLTDLRNGTGAVTPVFVKFSSDLSESALEAALEVCEGEGIAGYVLVNTTTSRADLLTSAEELAAIGAGGLSGRPLQSRAVEKVRFVHRLLGGKKPIIGVGGVDSGLSAYELIRAGASLIQLYTGLIYQGPTICKAIKLSLLELLRRDGYSTITEAIGSKS